jgi:hypothetical protein
MSEYKFHLKQPPASELVDKLLSVIEEVSPKCVITNFSFWTNAGLINFISNNQHREISTFKNRKDANGLLSSLTDRPYLDVTNISLQTNDDYSFSAGFENGFYIKLTTSGQRANDFQRIAPISDSLHKHFNLLRQQQVSESALPAAEKDALQTARTILLDFATQAAKLSQLSAANTERMNEIIIKKTEELDGRYVQRNKELDETYNLKNQALTEREEAFRKEKSGFDARENTVVRRDLLKQIERILGEQKRIEITPRTIRKRIPIHVICIFAMLAALCLSGVFGYKIYADSVVDWHHIAPFSTGILLFVSTAIFYIRWNDLWFKEHANAEFENRKFYVDTVRASWIAELLFEWKEKKEVPFPDQLINSYTTGLFESNDLVKTAKHPFDDIKSIAGNISEIKFSKSGGLSFKRNREPES